MHNWEYFDNAIQCSGGIYILSQPMNTTVVNIYSVTAAEYSYLTVECIWKCICHGRGILVYIQGIIQSNLVLLKVQSLDNNLVFGNLVYVYVYNPLKFYNS